MAVDLAIQAGHVANLGVVYALAPQARSRVTTVYMTTVFAGGAVGSLSAATTYAAMGWGGVASFCSLLALAALVGCATQLPSWPTDARRAVPRGRRLTMDEADAPATPTRVTGAVACDRSA